MKGVWRVAGHGWRVVTHLPYPICDLRDLQPGMETFRPESL